MKRFFRLFGLFIKYGAMNEMQYRINFFVQLAQSAISLFTGLAVLAIVFSYTDSLNGWSRPELLTLMGVHILMGGILNTIIYPNMGKIMEDVRQGTLDYTLTKPEDSQLLVSVRQFAIWRLVDVLTGLAVLAYAIIELGSNVGWAQSLSFLGALLMGVLLIYSVWLMVTTLAFKFIRIWDLLEMLQSFYQAGRWPITIYPDWLRASLTYLVPVAFAVTIPAETLTGRLSYITLLGALALTVVMMAIARRIWFFGLKNYTGASA